MKAQHLIRSNNAGLDLHYMKPIRAMAFWNSRDVQSLQSLQRVTNCYRSTSILISFNIYNNLFFRLLLTDSSHYPVTIISPRSVHYRSHYLNTVSQGFGLLSVPFSEERNDHLSLLKPEIVFLLELGTDQRKEHSSWSQEKIQSHVIVLVSNCDLFKFMLIG